MLLAFWNRNEGLLHAKQVLSSSSILLTPTSLLARGRGDPKGAGSGRGGQHLREAHSEKEHRCPGR